MNEVIEKLIVAMALAAVGTSAVPVTCQCTYILTNWLENQAFTPVILVGKSGVSRVQIDKCISIL